MEDKQRKSVYYTWTRPSTYIQF